MKLRAGPFFALTLFGVSITGCTTEPLPSKTAAAKAPVKTASVPAAAPAKATHTPEAAPAAVAAPAPVAPVAPVESVTPPPRPKLSPEAAAVVARLTQSVGPDTLPHELSDSTDFPEAISSLQAGASPPHVEPVDGSPQPPVKGLTADGNSTALIERDWTGLVLVPISASLSKAYTSEVRLLKVEAHPLQDGRVRVWTRVQNVGRSTVGAQIACSFRMRGTGPSSSPYFYQLDVPGKSYRDVFFVSPEGELTAYTVLVRSESMLTR